MDIKDVKENKSTHARDEGVVEALEDMNSFKGKVKRPMNAFMLWSKHERREISKSDATLHNAEISKLLGERWKMLSESDKQPYVEEAQKLMVIHKREHPDYRYKPRKNKLIKPMRAMQAFDFQNMQMEEPIGLRRRSFDDDYFFEKMARRYYRKKEKRICASQFKLNHRPYVISHESNVQQTGSFHDHGSLIRFVPYRNSSYRYPVECICGSYPLYDFAPLAPPTMAQKPYESQRSKPKSSFSVDSLLFKKENDIKQQNKASELSSCSSGGSEC